MRVLNLDELRARYASASGGEMFDPEFRDVADGVFKDGDRRQAPYCGVPTLLRAPHRPDAISANDIDVALLGIPMDLGVTHRAGARFGPRAVRNVDRIGPYEHVLRAVPPAGVRVADVGDVPFRSRFDLASCHEDIETFVSSVVDAGIIPLSVGGDHSISTPIAIRAAHSKVASSTTAGLSGKRCLTAFSTRGAQFRSASAAARNIYGNFRMSQG